VLCAREKRTSITPGPERRALCTRKTNIDHAGRLLIPNVTRLRSVRRVWFARQLLRQLFLIRCSISLNRGATLSAIVLSKSPSPSSWPFVWGPRFPHSRSTPRNVVFGRSYEKAGDLSGYLISRIYSFSLPVRSSFTTGWPLDSSSSETGWMHSKPSYFAELTIGETSWAFH